MKVNYKKATKVNNELKLNVYEQQDDITHLKWQCDIVYEDEVQEITAARTLMKKNWLVCVACIQTFAMKNVFKNDTQERAHWALVKLLWQNVQK